MQAKQKKKTAAELRAEIAFIKQHAIGDNITKIIIMLIQYGVLASIAYWVYKSIDTLAGKNTAANIDIKASGAFNLAEELSQSCTWIWILAILIVFAAVKYGVRQNKLRKDDIERLSRNNIELEKLIDDKRTSSTLTPRGDTNPEDQS